MAARKSPTLSCKRRSNCAESRAVVSRKAAPYVSKCAVDNRQMATGRVVQFNGVDQGLEKGRKPATIPTTDTRDEEFECMRGQKRAWPYRMAMPRACPLAASRTSCADEPKRKTRRMRNSARLQLVCDGLVALCWASLRRRCVSPIDREFVRKRHKRPFESNRVLGPLCALVRLSHPPCHATP